ncbi:hypothetical protein GJAV_G00078320 [Gymnothorax javanicus]|nr:hypothetical protein GJAV_G00078320 [Gymnothorax javanicus]
MDKNLGTAKWIFRTLFKMAAHRLIHRSCAADDFQVRKFQSLRPDQLNYHSGCGAGSGVLPRSPLPSGQILLTARTPRPVPPSLLQ